MSFQMELADCVTALGARLDGEEATLRGVSIDSRTIKQGELYVAIVGERFDGHDFVKAAQSAGAAAVLVHKEVETELPQLIVADTQIALGRLAKYWAQRFSLPTVAITGSNGKTTVKEIVTSILQQQGPVLATKGNLNNELGVPLTLLGMRSEHNYAVVEIGASHAGEIARLVALVEPDVAVVTNVGTAHLEGFGSVQGIAQAKSEIYAGLKSSGYGVINADDAFADFMRDACSHCLTREFGHGETVDVRRVPDRHLLIDSMGEVLTPRFRLAGEHNVTNALAAVAAAQCLDVQNDSIVKGLEAVTPVPGRLETKSGVNSAVVIDDSYNANPDSVRSAVDVLCACQGKRYLVLGDMGELGTDAVALHAELGEYARCKGVDALWTTGTLTAALQESFNVASDSGTSVLGGHFADHEQLAEDLLAHLDHDVTVLVKGSRSARMEVIANALLSPASPIMTASVSS